MSVSRRHDPFPVGAPYHGIYSHGVRPAITTLFVAGLVSPDWLVEVEGVACAE